jgi:RsiW-degrading membrane proteinase PrsW (M82 family)
MNYLSQNFMETVKLLGKNVNQTVIDNINNLVIPDLSKEDNKAAQNNKKVMNQVIKVNIIFILFILVVVYFIYKNSDKSYNLKHIIKENFIILVFIGFVEYSFLTFFGAEYISIDPNQAKLSILESLKEHKQNH